MPTPATQPFRHGTWLQATHPLGTLQVDSLCLHRQHLPWLAQGFTQAWPGWYGPGGEGDVQADLQAFAQGGKALPMGVLALLNGQPVGAAALKAQSIPSHAHLGPWAAAGWVLPAHRGQGLGALLLQGLANMAQANGHHTLYCGTSTAATLLQRGGWQALETVQHAGQPLTVFSLALQGPATTKDAANT